MQSYVFDALLNYCWYRKKNNIRYKLKFLISSGNKHGGYKEGRLYNCEHMSAQGISHS